MGATDHPTASYTLREGAGSLNHTTQAAPRAHPSPSPRAKYGGDGQSQAPLAVPAGNAGSMIAPRATPNRIVSCRYSDEKLAQAQLDGDAVAFTNAGGKEALPR